MNRVDLDRPPTDRDASTGAARSSVPGLLFWAPTITIVTSAVFLILLLAYYRDKAIDTGEHLTSSFAQLSEEHTVRTLESVSRAIEAAYDRTTSVTPHSAVPAVNAMLRDRLEGRPFIHSLQIADRSGRILFSTDGSTGTDISGRSYFKIYRPATASDFELGEPTRFVGASGPDAWYIPAIRPWRDARGEIVGIIVALVEPSYFARIWALDGDNKETSIALFRGDGMLLARAPFDEIMMGRAARDTPGFIKLLPARSTGTFQTDSAAGVPSHIFSYRRLEAFPDYVILVGNSIDNVLEEWRQYTRIIVIGWCVASVVLAGLCFWLFGEWRRRQENETRYQLLFDGSPNPMWVFDRITLRFLAVNDAAVARYGWSRAEFLAMTLEEIRRPEDIAGLRTVLREYDIGAPGTIHQVKHRLRNGALIEVESTVRLIDFAGRQAAIVLAQDVTERRRSEEQLRQAQKMEAVGQMTGGIAHDFNNLLAIIMMKMEVLIEDLPPDSPVLPYATGTLSAAIRGADLVKRLLTFSRSGALTPVKIDVAVMLAGFRPLLVAAVPQVDLTIEVAGDLHPCLVDLTGLETAILNLAVNARDAMPPRGALRIAARHRSIGTDDPGLKPGTIPGEWLEISVTDAGSGMSPDIQAKVFEPFFTTKAAGHGTGLGLSMVYGFVIRSGGFATIDSTVGIGTTISLYLPEVACADDVVDPALPSTAAPVPISLQRAA